ncbi:MAG TPA: nucleotide exchange factor GrpE [Deltaproteobacteria bacterium]|nr:nucleotide exchange factor GrpE [Deltaproteobacteria bacterium]
MSRRYPLTQRGEVIDAESARRAIGQVVAQRDALSQQLSRAQSAIASLQHQLEARRDESAHLAQALQAMESRQPLSELPGPDPDALRRLQQELAEQRQRAEAAEARAEQLQLRCEEALAERDREHAARLAAELARVAQAPPPDSDRAQRLAADLANVRRHQDEAIAQGVRQGTVKLLAELASIRDTIDRAIAANPTGSGPWHDGLLAIRSKIDAGLAREGAIPFGSAGERFDPSLHEPLGIAGEGPPDLVHEVVSSGLMLDDGTVVVPARVIVTG